MLRWVMKVPTICIVNLNHYRFPNPNLNFNLKEDKKMKRLFHNIWVRCLRVLSPPKTGPRLITPEEHKEDIKRLQEKAGSLASLRDRG
jgi:hypothetical protein